MRKAILNNASLQQKLHFSGKQRMGCIKVTGAHRCVVSWALVHAKQITVRCSLKTNYNNNKMRYVLVAVRY
jgi:hypothetical protein